MTRLMDLNTSLLKTCESWNMNSNYQKWHNTTSKDTEERIALRIARWRMLELPRNESRWKLREGNKSLMNHHVEPPWRTPLNKRMIKWKEKGSWKHKVKPCNDLDEALRRDKVETWNSGKERWTNEIKNLKGLRNKELISWLKQE